MLRHALLVNAAFSFSCGTLALINRDSLQDHIPLPTDLLTLGACGLICFSLLLIWVRSDQARSIIKARSIIVADILWVIAASVMAAIFHQQLSSTGLTLVIATNCCVALLALMQLIGLKHLTREQSYAGVSKEKHR